jgi:hypothetical protein
VMNWSGDVFNFPLSLPGIDGGPTLVQWPWQYGVRGASSGSSVSSVFSFFFVLWKWTTLPGEKPTVAEIYRERCCWVACREICCMR